MENYFEHCTTEDQVKNKFRKLSKQFHPDKNPAGAETFKIILQQRDTAMRAILQGRGVKDSDIDLEIEKIFAGNVNKNISSIVDGLSDKWMNENPGKEPDIMSITKMVFGELFKANKSTTKNISGTEYKKRLD